MAHFECLCEPGQTCIGDATSPCSSGNVMNLENGMQTCEGVREFLLWLEEEGGGGGGGHSLSMS